MEQAAESATERLYVLKDDEAVATIETQDRLQWRFAFTRQGIESGIELSNSFSLGDEVVDNAIAKNWFSNLLPEGRARDRLVASEALADNDFALLKHIGLDCAGALVITEALPPPGEVKPRVKISKQQLEAWSKERATLELNVLSGEPARMSLAGTQRKWAVVLEAGEYYFPATQEPSTHIIKAAEKHSIILNEIYMNTLAWLFGLPVPHCHIESVGKGLFFCIERYDRQRNDGGTTRLHQEDMCQVLGVPAARKYQKDKGPRLSDCVAVIREHCTARAPVLDIMQLIRWQIFNVICGNSDGHAKNIALLQDERGRWSLAPAYDLVSTQALKIYSPELGFAVGDNFLPGAISQKDWHRMAEDCGIAKSQIINEVKQALTKLESLYQSAELRSELEKRGVEAHYWRKLEPPILYIARQSKRIRKQLAYP